MSERTQISADGASAGTAASPARVGEMARVRSQPDSLRQQARFDDFISEFNTERLREALNMKRPQQVYAFATALQGTARGLPESELNIAVTGILRSESALTQ